MHSEELDFLLKLDSSHVSVKQSQVRRPAHLQRGTHVELPQRSCQLCEHIMQCNEMLVADWYRQGIAVFDEPLVLSYSFIRML